MGSAPRQRINTQTSDNNRVHLVWMEHSALLKSSTWEIPGIAIVSHGDESEGMCIWVHIKQSVHA